MPFNTLFYGAIFGIALFATVDLLKLAFEEKRRSQLEKQISQLEKEISQLEKEIYE